MNRNYNIALMALAVIAAFGLVMVSVVVLPSIIQQAQAQQQTKSAIIKVQVGGGNNTYPFYGYNPQHIQVKVGSSIVWIAPSNAPLVPHSVSFVLNSSTMTGPDALFSIPSSTKFIPLSPGSNTEPVIVPGSIKNGMETIIVYNGRSYNPAVIDSTGNEKTLSPNTSFTMTGSEQYVNSGRLVPAAGQKIYPGSSSTFAVTFQKAGTYDYVCELHPWMRGSVVVK